MAAKCPPAPRVVSPNTRGARALDQFFTTRTVARECIEFLNRTVRRSDYLWIEPSAGAGVFLDLLPFPRIGFDIAPRRNDIQRRDFLTWQYTDVSRRVGVVGNPPFGKNASLARRFFDHAANFANVIAFIVPRTFEKPNFVNKLDRRMHLLAQMALPTLAFEFEGQPYAVPTVFQVWQRRSQLRPLTPLTRSHPDFEFVSCERGDFAFQRVGARAGLASKDGLRKSPQSHYFLKAIRPSPEALCDRLNTIDWAPIKSRTAGNPSIGKADLVAAYRDYGEASR